MNTLVLDTATQIEHVAARSGCVVSDITRRMDRSHSATLFINIDSALRGAGISARELELVGVGIGPGSFTGIRIAVSTARALAQVLGVPLVGIHSPLLFAASVRASAGTHILVAFDAKKGRVFGALYQRQGDGQDRAIVAPGDYEMQLLARAIPAGSAVMAAGDGVFRYRDELDHGECRISFLEDFAPEGASSCALAERAYRSDPSRWSDLTAIVPDYARKSDAEVVRDLKRQSGS